MDYKHRVPGYQRRKTGKPIRLWIGAALASTVFILALWLIFGGDDDEVATKDEPAPASVTQLPAPPIPKPAPPADKKPAKASGKTEGKAAPAGEGQAEAPKSAEPPKKDAAAAPTKAPEPRFSFYRILPEKEVIIPESDIKSIKREEAQGKKSGEAVYEIQVGSFAKLADAEKLKADLSRLKVKSKVENVKIDDAEWHRVKVGPFKSLADADRTRVYLRGNHIDSIVQRATGR